MHSKTLDRILRFAALLSFFHFAGLNNGICSMALQAGQMGRADFAPVALRHSLSVFRPSVWKNAFRHDRGLRLFTRSGQIIETASQNAVQHMLVKSGFVQLWVNQSLKNMRAPSLGSGTVVFAELLAAPSSTHFTPSQERFDRSTVQTQTLKTEHSLVVALESPSYAEGGRKESWLKTKPISAWKWEHWRERNINPLGFAPMLFGHCTPPGGINTLSPPIHFSSVFERLRRKAVYARLAHSGHPVMVSSGGSTVL